MRIYVLRHGIAEPRQSGKPDAARKLTPDGKDKLTRVLGRAVQAGVKPSAILSSPLARAIQTAEIAAQTLDYEGRIVRTEALDPASTPEQLWDEIRTRNNEKQLLVAGHEPHLSASVAYLLGVPGLALDLKKGALVRIDMDGFDGEPKGVLKWILTPALA
ncbi:MAG TPA: phosphohistidine phosphatase SixA [Bryobacteraceae bacterium]|nr:phosphohistidine phosphatase SixA [Bryobacteraceae bacterium]